MEAGITIKPDDLLFVHKVEKFLECELGAGDLRCGITAVGVRVEASQHLKDRHCSWLLI
ncbi:MAG: hypothetical protein ACI8VW_003873 [bacterium]